MKYILAITLALIFTATVLPVSAVHEPIAVAQLDAEPSIRIQDKPGLLTFTQPDGKRVWINAKQVEAVLEKPVGAAEGTNTQIWISDTEYYNVRELADRVAARVGLKVHFTTPTDHLVWIDERAVTGVRHPIGGDPGAKCELRLTEGVHFFLKEPPEEVAAGIHPMPDND